VEPAKVFASMSSTLTQATSGAGVFMQITEQATERRWVSNVGSKDRPFECGYVTRRLAPGFATGQIPRHEHVGPYGLSKQRDGQHYSRDDERPEPGMASSSSEHRVHQQRVGDYRGKAEPRPCKTTTSPSADRPA
jgi:hypothetical protein